MKIRTYKEYDVIAAGGGPAGCAASAAFAGAAFEIAPVRQPASLCFILTHVDFTNFVPEKMNGAHPKSPIHKILALGDKYPLIRDTHFCIDVLYEGTVSFNVGHLPEVDDTDPGAADNAMVVGREMAAQYRDALAEVFPDNIARNCYYLDVHTSVGESAESGGTRGVV